LTTTIKKPTHNINFASRDVFIKPEIVNLIATIYMKDRVMKSALAYGIGMYYRSIKDALEVDPKILHKRYSVMKEHRI